MSFRQKEGCSRSSATDAASPGAGPQTIRFSFTVRRRRSPVTIGMINLATRKAGTYLQSSQFSLFHATLTHDGRWITFVALDRQASPSRLEVLAAPFQRDTPSKESDWIQGRQRPALERQTALVTGWKPHLLCLGSRRLCLPLDAAPGARNQAARGAASAPLPHPPGTALDPECWLRPDGYCSRTRQDCAQPG